MTIKTIITEPNEILRQVSKPAQTVGNEERKLMDDMLETMYAANGMVWQQSKLVFQKGL